MSKSEPSDYSRINLSDDTDTIIQKIKKAKTDPLPLPELGEDLKARPEVENLLGIFAAITGKSVPEILTDFSGQQFSTFKSALSDALVERLAPIRGELTRWQQHPDEIDKILADGANRARTIAAPILKNAKEIIGFLG